MGGMQSEVHQNTASSSSTQPQMGSPSGSSFGRSIIKSFSLVSQLFAHKISWEKKPPSCEKEESLATPEVVIAPESQEVAEKCEEVFEESQKNEVIEREEPQKKGPVTLKNFEQHLKELWERDPTLPPEDFFKLANKLFSLV